jgi:osmoprotectant transport system ATP-binding protein
MVEALVLGDRIAVMETGRLVQIGTPGTLMREPADDYVRRLLDTPRREAQLVESLLTREPLS